MAIVVATAAVLLWMGRNPWCHQGDLTPVSLDIWSAHNSQHLVDWYSLSHVLHGVVFFGGLWVVLRRYGHAVRIPVAMGIEAMWEIGENTNAMVERYRETTISLDYFGDSVANSVADLLACLAGYGFTMMVPAWGAVLFFFAVEALMLGAIRDSLTLNVVMLVKPLDGVLEWQIEAAPDHVREANR